MDIQVSAEDFKSFLKKCYCGGLVKDLVIQANEEKNLFARFSTKDKYMYAEVYLPNVKIYTEGLIKIPHVKKLLDVISRADSKMIRIVSSEDAFCVTDGSSIGKMKSDMLQVGDAEIVDSYDSFAEYGKVFDTEELKYIPIDVKYENGCNVTCGMISEVLKDAKAFGYELYNFQVQKSKGGKHQLRAYIVNQYTTEKMKRVLSDGPFIGSKDKIGSTFVAKGFREIMEGLISEEHEEVSIYIDDLSWLITDNKTYYFNLHTMEEE